MFDVGDEAGEDARHGRGLLNVRPVPGTGDVGGLGVRESAGDFVVDQVAGGEGVVASLPPTPDQDRSIADDRGQLHRRRDTNLAGTRTHIGTAAIC
jgi:hypothetical protein